MDNQKYLYGDGSISIIKNASKLIYVCQYVPGLDNKITIKNKKSGKVSSNVSDNFMTISDLIDSILSENPAGTVDVLSDIYCSRYNYTGSYLLKLPDPMINDTDIDNMKKCLHMRKKWANRNSNVECSCCMRILADIVPYAEMISAVMRNFIFSFRYIHKKNDVIELVSAIFFGTRRYSLDNMIEKIRTLLGDQYIDMAKILQLPESMYDDKLCILYHRSVKMSINDISEHSKFINDSKFRLSLDYIDTINDWDTAFNIKDIVDFAKLVIKMCEDMILLLTKLQLTNRIDPCIFDTIGKSTHTKYIVISTNVITNFPNDYDLVAQIR